jgi:catechol-2,3-dioxygenase
MRAFYGDTLGLPFIGEADGCFLFDLGDNTTLELAAEGVARPPPAMQMSSLAAMILRVVDTARLRADLKAAGVHFVHDLIQTPKGELSYFSDPEGNVIGISERVHAGVYVGTAPTALPLVTLEDAEAQRRWVEFNAAHAPPLAERE